MLPYSEACERNKDYILDRLSEHLLEPARVLEIGSGTGQHAVHFARALPHLEWLTSDLPGHIPGIQARIAVSGLENLPEPISLDVADDPWPVESADAIFSANTLHIVSREHVEYFFRGVGRILSDGGWLIVYGPFKYGGKFTTESNANFDLWLKRRDPVSGVRDFEEVDELARRQGLSVIADYPMPANNQLLVWRKQASVIRDQEIGNRF